MPSPSPADAQQYVATSLAYKRQTARLRAQTASAVSRMWSALGSWRQDDIEPFVQQVVPIVNGAQQVMMALTTAYLAQQAQTILGGAVRPVSVNQASVVGAAVRRGVAPRDVYERPFHLVWRQLASLPRQAGSIDQAIRAGHDRAMSLALDDLQLTKVQTAHRVLDVDSRVTGYRRTLEGAHSCALCIVASTQIYHRRDLMPIHGGCDCDVAPIYGHMDPGHVIDPALLKDVHSRIMNRFGINARDAREIPAHGLPNYHDVLIEHEHGELGAVLGVRGQPFTGPDDLAH